MDELQEQRLRERWRTELDEETRTLLREKALTAMSRVAAKEGMNATPAEISAEAPADIIETFCLAMLSHYADAGAQIEEHVTGDDYGRWFNEEVTRLWNSGEYPEGVPEDTLVDAVTDRMRDEKPEVFQSK